MESELSAHLLRLTHAVVATGLLIVGAVLLTAGLFDPFVLVAIAALVLTWAVFFRATRRAAKQGRFDLAIGIALTLIWVAQLGFVALAFAPVG